MSQSDLWKQRLNRRLTWVAVLFGVLAILYLALNAFEYYTSPASHIIIIFLPALFMVFALIRTAMLRPTIPFEEYDQKMHALLEVVTERTGLMLYDLRDTSNKWYM